jgi:FkbM family methyltransferase
MNFETQLDAILRHDPQTVQASLANEFAKKCGARPIVLFGAGPLGQITLTALKNTTIQTVALSDNNSAHWGKVIDGIRVLSPQEAVARYASDAAFVVTIYNPSKVMEQLRELGCERVVSAALLFRAHIESMGPHGSFDDPSAIFEQSEKVRAAFSLFADDESRGEYLAQLQWRTTPDFDAMIPARPGKEIYFPEELFSLRNDESYVDCGAFDGDTLRMMLARRGADFKQFVGFEPDPDNFARFEKFVSSLPEDQRIKIEGRNAATGAHSGFVRFNAVGTAGSGISGEGEVEAACVSLDDALDFVPSFIKMDIEGAEPDALRGAQATFTEYHPIGAICVYHATDHLWEIPLLLHEFCPDSRIYLRRYAEECWELVCYVVPPER